METVHFLKSHCAKMSWVLRKLGSSEETTLQIHQFFSFSPFGVPRLFRVTAKCMNCFLWCKKFINTHILRACMY